MAFNSFTFLIFLFFIIVSYWLFIKKRKIKIFIIFTSSLFFYGFWEIKFIPLILFSILINYYLAIYIDLITTDFKKKIILFFTLFLNLAILAVFKYYFFFSENINLIFKNLEINMENHLSIEVKRK